MKRSMRAAIWVGGALGIVGSAQAAPSIATALFQEGAQLPNAPAGLTVSSINNPAVNTVDGFAFAVNVQDDGLTTFSYIWGHATGGTGAPLISEATYGDLQQTAFESFYGLADDGSAAYSASGNYISSGSSFDSVFVDATKITARGDAVPTVPGQYTSFASRPGIFADGTPYFAGGLTATQGSSTSQNRALFKGAGMDVVYMGGDLLGNTGGDLVSTSTIDFDYRFSRGGTNWISPVTLSATSSTDSILVINGDGVILDGTVMREGNPVPGTVTPFVENYAAFDFVGINDAGDWFVTGDTNGAIATDEFVMKNGVIVSREGDAVTSPLGPGTIDGAIEAAYMNENGDWAAIWDLTVGGNNLEALFVNGAPLLVETMKVDWNGDGSIDALDNNGRVANFTGISSLAVGEPDVNGFFDVYFTADIDFNGTSSTLDDLEGAFVLHVPAPGAGGLLALAGIGLLRRSRR